MTRRTLRLALLVLASLIGLAGFVYASQPLNGCETCLSQGYPYWFCVLVYGPLC